VSGGRLALVILGFVLLAVGGYVYAVSGLVVPMPYLLLLWLVWVVAVVVAIVKRRQPAVVIGMGLVAAVFWFAYVQGLGSVLGWSA
jgi:hypothetical protein